MQAADRYFGNQAEFCGGCVKAGQGKCQFGECLAPVPLLSFVDNLVVTLFAECSTQWEFVSGFAGAVKIGIPFERVKILADAMCIPLNEEVLLKFNRIVKFLKIQDAENAERNKKS